MGLLSGRSVREFQGDGFVDPNVIPSNSAGGRPSFASTRLHSTEAAQRTIAVSSSVNLFGNLISGLPVDGYSGRGQSKSSVTLPPLEWRRSSI